MSLIPRKTIVSFANNRFVQLLLYNPLLDYHQYSILKFVKTEAKKIPAGKSILDVGAGELRYKQYFQHCHYVSQDLGVGNNEWYFDNIDIKSTIYNVPVKKNSFDYVLCTQVLEHLEYPDRAFKEFHRILKKNGKLILTAPLGQGEHQIPYDFFRYTKYSLKNLGERYGLRLVYIFPHGGIFINLDYMFGSALWKLIPFKKYQFMRYLWFLLLSPVLVVLGAISLFLDSFDREKDYTLNYNCVYIKK